MFLVASLTLPSCSDREAGERYVIGVSQCTSDAWRDAMNQDLRREALFHDNLELRFRSGDGDSRKQVEDIDAFVREGVDLLVVAPNEASPVTPAVEHAFDKGIPVIVVDRKIVSEKFTAFVGADNYQIGKSIGLYVGKSLA